MKNQGRLFVYGCFLCSNNNKEFVCLLFTLRRDHWIKDRIQRVSIHRKASALGKMMPMKEVMRLRIQSRREDLHILEWHFAQDAKRNIKCEVICFDNSESKRISSYL